MKKTLVVVQDDETEAKLCRILIATSGLNISTYVYFVDRWFFYFLYEISCVYLVWLYTRFPFFRKKLYHAITLNVCVCVHNTICIYCCRCLCMY